MIDIALFGSTVVHHDGHRSEAGELGGVKPRQILEMLALDLGSPVPKDVLAERLWEGQPPASYLATLESYVCVLRRRLGIGRGSRAVGLVTTNKGYLLDPDHVQVDLAVVRDMLASARATDTGRALELAAGPLLGSEPYATWANQARESFAEVLTAGCTRGARLANEAGDWALGVRLGRAAVQQSYFTESAWQELMRALWRSGDRTQALHAFAELRAGILDELGVEPGPVTQELYVEILRSGSGPAARESDRQEVRTLLRLLRQALEAGAGADEPGLVEVGRLMLSRAAVA